MEMYSAAAIALGLGDIKFPAFPPPIIAKRMAGFDKSVRRASAKAIGETVITATSINTPTAVKIMWPTLTLIMLLFHLTCL